MATMRPSNQTRQCDAVPRGALQKARMPRKAKGTAERNPTSASDGYGVGMFRPTSKQDHTNSPAAQSPVEMLISAQANLSLPVERVAAHAHAADASAAATASPMSSTAVTPRGPRSR